MTVRRDRDAMLGLDAAPARWTDIEAPARPGTSPEARETPPCHPGEQDIEDEQRFLAAWEQGLVPELCHYVRVRQLHRAGLVQGLYRRSR